MADDALTRKEAEMGRMMTEKLVKLRDVVLGEGEPGWQVWLEIGNQYFPVGNAYDVQSDAEWYADMLRKALRALSLESVHEEAVAWAVTCNGMLIEGNVFGSIEDAGRCKDRLDAGFPHDKREIIPLFLQHAPARVAEGDDIVNLM